MLSYLCYFGIRIYRLTLIYFYQLELIGQSIGYLYPYGNWTASLEYKHIQSIYEYPKACNLIRGNIELGATCL